jgi:hypothetical protein
MNGLSLNMTFTRMDHHRHVIGSYKLMKIIKMNFHLLYKNLISVASHCNRGYDN